MLDIDDVPDLPLIGCVSEQGCQCYFTECELENRYGGDSGSDRDEHEVASCGIDLGEALEEGAETDYYSLLKQLKQMLDDRLIGQEEYDSKKAQILARM